MQNNKKLKGTIFKLNSVIYCKGISTHEKKEEKKSLMSSVFFLPKRKQVLNTVKNNQNV